MKALLLICSVLLVLALADLPIGYYTFLRIAVTFGALAVVVKEYDGELSPWIITFGLIAILFNPLIPIYFHDKEVWTVIDLIVAAIFTFKSYTLKK